jgi:hypothetical protein
MTARVELTDAERGRIAKTIEVSAALSVVEAEWVVGHLAPDVELIVAARVAEALRDAADQAMPISGYMGNHRWISSEKLRAVAAEYDPNGARP